MLLSIFYRINASAQKQETIQLADPTVFYHNHTYYLYGTVSADSDNGFKAYISKDGKNWIDKGVVLKKGDAFGTRGFWAPQVFKRKNTFYMAYVANENIAIATSKSPLGPFVQRVKKSISAPVRMIDPFMFFDNGKIYLYHVRLTNGNRIFVTEMNPDFASIKEETTKECISASIDWENTQQANWSVTEGPTVFKRNEMYYLFYSANDFRNPNYAVGYATSKSPNGPWSKYKNNPILSKIETGMNGSGHGDFFMARRRQLYYVFHTHESNVKTGKRKTAIIAAQFIKNGAGLEILKTDSTSFEYLYK